MPTEDHGENAPQEIHCFIGFRKKTTNTCIKGNNQRNRELWKILQAIEGKTAFALTAIKPNVSNEEHVTQKNIFLLL